jgi:hypothetical protein
VINAASGSGCNTAHIVSIGSGDFVYFDRLHGLCSQNTLGHRFHKVMSPFADRTCSYIARTTGEIVLFTAVERVQSGLRSITRDIQNAGSSQITVRQIVVYVRIRRPLKTLSTRSLTC